MSDKAPKLPQAHRPASELDRLAQEAARLSYEDELSHEEISLRIGAKDARDVAKLIARARNPKNPLVRVRVDEIGGALALQDETMARTLAERTGIRRVVVVKTALPSGHRSWEAEGQQAVVLSHVLHRQLGRAAAKFLWDRITDRDVIAVGAGRGVRYTVDALRSFAASEPRSFADLRVVALAGNGVVRPYPRTAGESGDGIRGWPELEPDQIALELGRVLNVDVRRVTLARLPFVLANPDSVVPQVAPHLDGNVPWGDETPDKAIFGLGVLQHDHHLLASVGSNVTKPVEPLLEKLQREVLTRYPSAVLDVYDNFWVQEGVLPPDVEQRAKDLVEQLNEMVVVAPREKTNQAREKILVSGGPLKYQGLLAYVRQYVTVGVTPTVLVTDDVSAARLLEDLRER